MASHRARAEEPVGWGVIGCADIARKTCEGVSEAANAKVVAVGSRSLEKAEAFARACAPGAKAYGSYDAVLEDDDVEVVYIPLPTTMRKEWVLKAARSKKHVLCEKPIAATLEDAQEMVEACRQAGVQFMDNTMFMHNDRLGEMRKVLDQKEVFGELRHVVCCFTIPFGNDAGWAKGNIRMSAATEPLGCLGDLGWYCVRVSLWAFEYKDPADVSCHYFEETGEGVPITAHAILRWPGARTASFDCSFKCTLRQWAEVAGEKCSLTWDDLCVTQAKAEASFSVAKATIGKKAVTFPKEVLETQRVEGCVQHTRLVQRMSDLARSGTAEAFWPEVTMQTQRVMMALHASARKGGAWVNLQA